MLSIFGNSLDGSELAGSLGLKWCTKFTLLEIDFDQSLEEMDLIPVEQPWCKNWMIVDIIDERMEFRHHSLITLPTRKIQEYEYKKLI